MIILIKNHAFPLENNLGRKTLNKMTSWNSSASHQTDKTENQNNLEKSQQNNNPRISFSFAIGHKAGPPHCINRMNSFDIILLHENARKGRYWRPDENQTLRRSPDDGSRVSMEEGLAKYLSRITSDNINVPHLIEEEMLQRSSWEIGLQGRSGQVPSGDGEGCRRRLVARCSGSLR